MIFDRNKKSFWKQQKHCRIATWNLQGGIRHRHDQEILARDMERLGIAVCGLQETKYNVECTIKTNSGYIINLPADKNTPAAKRYGQGFYVSNEWYQQFWGVKYITDRISTIEFLMNGTDFRRSSLIIVNVYAPTSKIVTDDIESANEFYDRLQQVYRDCSRKASLVIIVGDLNSKIGLRQDDETFMGHFGKGTRNRNGHLLANFLTINNLYLTNTTFCHHMRHRSTWSGRINGQQIYNQIDYVIVPNRWYKGRRDLLKDSRSYNATTFRSDHKLVATTIDFTNIYKRPARAPRPQLIEYDRNTIGTDAQQRKDYEQEFNALISENLQNVNVAELSPNEYGTLLNNATLEAAKLTMPLPTPEEKRQMSSSPHYMLDKALARWSAEAAQIRRRMENSTKARKIRRLRKKHHLRN
jgi:exonuclease III